MKPTAATCRAQQAHQLVLASNTALPNVRNIATVAAAAWAREALAADKRDERATCRKQDAADVVLRLELPGHQDRGFSENPDRGFADADAAPS
jgi:hypothetical protein